ncbi:phosphopantetheine-binding protein [Actinokineospora sp. PR83]|uniref:phosphopantetheine-binding protein n=1 Tax=Actinokineospora sp. PR83 TaxID=2884908 RepID=UPI0027E0C336|nr:phosphopantetheine-binding protein [Actinokineospora sp. PR83]MCG8920575.1 phosphopantetheine-binding protein [Actinokineospora sp. PR83]
MQHAHAITQFVLDEFLPDVAAADLDPHADLIADGVIDSLGLLKLLVWLENGYGIRADDVELTPDRFRSVAAIDAFITAHATAPAEAS